MAPTRGWLTDSVTLRVLGDEIIFSLHIIHMMRKCFSLLIRLLVKITKLSKATQETTQPISSITSQINSPAENSAHAHHFFDFYFPPARRRVTRGPPIPVRDWSLESLFATWGLIPRSCFLSIRIDPSGHKLRDGDQYNNSLTIIYLLQGSIPQE